jgi:hypothetical protein
VSWRGQRIELVEGYFHRELWADGKLVSWGTALQPGRLKGTLTDGALGEVPIVWVATRGTLHAVYVGGNRISGTLTDLEAAAQSRWPEPSDPRWPAARALLESLDHSGDPEVREATRQVGNGLRDALRHLLVLQETAEHHMALGGDVELASARQALDEDVERWLVAVRELHLRSTVNAGSADAFLAQVRAETEVDAAVRAKARALASRLAERG